MKGQAYNKKPRMEMQGVLMKIKNLLFDCAAYVVPDSFVRFVYTLDLAFIKAFSFPEPVAYIKKDNRIYHANGYCYQGCGFKQTHIIKIEAIIRP
jgi:hypothetical protein